MGLGKLLGGFPYVENKTKTIPLSKVARDTPGIDPREPPPKGGSTGAIIEIIPRLGEGSPREAGFPQAGFPFSQPESDSAAATAWGGGGQGRIPGDQPRELPGEPPGDLFLSVL